MTNGSTYTVSVDGTATEATAGEGGGMGGGMGGGGTFEVVDATINITGGTVTVNTNGDGIDSNGDGNPLRWHPDRERSLHRR